MSRLDRYIIAEVLGPFLFGLAFFVIMLFSADLLRRAFVVIVDQHVPVRIALQAMTLQVPQVVVYTLPMATLFGVMMAMGRMSSQSEMIAIQAGGISFTRAAAPILALSLGLSLLTGVLAERVTPAAEKSARRLLSSAGVGAAAVKHDIFLKLPPHKPVEKEVYVGEFDVARMTLKDVLIFDLREGAAWQWYVAGQARWDGECLLLQNVEHRTDDGRRIMRLDEVKYTIGRAPFDVVGYSRDPRDMSLSELRGRIHQVEGEDPGGDELRALRGQFYGRSAVPWSALGFALLGASLGVRSHRTGTGVGLGISLAVILVYYALASAATGIGAHTAPQALIANWLPNMVLFAVGLTLLARRAR